MNVPVCSTDNVKREKRRDREHLFASQVLTQAGNKYKMEVLRVAVVLISDTLPPTASLSFRGTSWGVPLTCEEQLRQYRKRAGFILARHKARAHTITIITIPLRCGEPTEGSRTLSNRK